MENKIILTLSKPYSVVLENVAVDRVLLPAAKGDITILPQRAPTQLLLRDGVMHILDANGKPTETYFLKGGVAEVASNQCMVAAEDAFTFDRMSLPQVEELLSREEEYHLGDRGFYQMIADYLKSMK